VGLRNHVEILHENGQFGRKISVNHAKRAERAWGVIGCAQRTICIRQSVQISSGRSILRTTTQWHARYFSRPRDDWLTWVCAGDDDLYDAGRLAVVTTSDHLYVVLAARLQVLDYRPLVGRRWRRHTPLQRTCTTSTSLVLPTALAREVMQSPASVRPSVCGHCNF